MSLIKTVLNFRKTYSNWLSVLIKLYRTRNIKNKINIMVKVRPKGTEKTLNVSRVNVFHYADLYAAFRLNSNPKIKNMSIDQNSVSFFYDRYYLKFDGIDIGAIYETFINDAYSYLKVEDKIVIDIGANIGDTAIYFAIKGAKKVISLEPYPYIFAFAIKNIDSFEFKDKIELINAGYGEDKEIKIDVSFIPDNGSDIKESESGININLYSLKTLINKYNIDSGILKMDCEGCEYDLLNEDDEIIKKFSMIQIEYHYGYEKLVDKLKECGFAVKYTEPKKSYNPYAGKTMIVGFIYAEK